jgi:hypothetical protein
MSKRSKNITQNLKEEELMALLEKIIIKIRKEVVGIYIYIYIFPKVA